MATNTSVARAAPSNLGNGLSILSLRGEEPCFCLRERQSDDSDIRGTRARGCVSVCMCVGVREGDDDDAIDDDAIDDENNKKSVKKLLTILIIFSKIIIRDMDKTYL